MTRKSITIPPPTKLRVWVRTQEEMNRQRDEMHRRLGTPDSFADDEDYTTNSDRQRVKKPTRACKAKKQSNKPQERRIESLTPILAALTAPEAVDSRRSRFTQWDNAAKK